MSSNKHTNVDELKVVILATGFFGCIYNTSLPHNGSLGTCKSDQRRGTQYFKIKPFYFREH
jgi:hypothetical protein